MELDRGRPIAAFAAGAATLVVELTLLRYVPGEIRVLGYFTNFVLFAAFLGIGVGILLARRGVGATVSRLAPVAFAVVVCGVLAGELLHVAPTADEFLFLQYQTARAQVSLYGFLTVSFVLLAVGFLPLGHVVGRTLEGDGPLVRYVWNIAGSIGGIALFTTVSTLGAHPVVWILLSGALSCIGVADASWWWRASALAAVLVATIAGFTATSGSVWSPYQKITTAPLLVHPDLGVVTEWRLRTLDSRERARLRAIPEGEGFVIRVNEDSYQFPADLSDAAVARRPGLKALRVQYDTAFRVRRRAGRVLVLGAGAGNDVAAALRAGATRVDAVEIDPEILRLGARHPERPYSDRRVRAIVDDGRAWLARTTERYDTIVYALIDSHVLASQRTNVRLDSFVFTQESFVLARRRLRPRGIVVVSHALGEDRFVRRMRATLAAAFGRPPFLVSSVIPHPIGIVYASGTSVPAGAAVESGADPLTDDWPFVYLRERSVPSDYLATIVLVLLVTAVTLTALRWLRTPGAPAPIRRVASVRPLFFALGAGFLLLETRGLAVLGVLVGNTWQNASVVFVGVLVMALVGTGVAARIRPTHAGITTHAAFVFLFVALAVCWMVPVATLVGLPWWLAVTLAAPMIALPVLASGVVYALELQREGDADAALGSNLIGALAGGLAEYASMLVGMRALIVLAAAFYLLAWVAVVVRRRARPATPAPAEASIV
ncbi:MAG: hypothetical protein IT379_39810 [Deltaproteobacteria bacterium]|nr:hypothetical protein [Deltaproteobacteria bacterium]